MGKEIRNKICIPSEIEKTNNSAAIHMAEKPISQIMLCNQKNCTGKPRYHNGFGVFSCPDFQVQTKRCFSLLRGLELPPPTISGGF
jgi:hypothetical protein